MATKTIGDYWRSCSNEELATNMVDFLISLLVSAGIPEDEIDMITEYAIMQEFFNTEYDDVEDKKPTSNGFSYIN